MSVPLPYSLGSPISSWQVYDWSTRVLTTLPAAGGVATATCDQLGDDEQWLIDRAVAQCTSATSTTLKLYDSSVADRQLLSGTRTGNLDEAEYPMGLLLRSQSTLVAVWTGCSDGAIGTLRIQARLMKRVAH